MKKAPPSVAEKNARLTSDHDAYTACMTVIQTRLFTLQKVLRDEIYIPYNLLKVEFVYIQFRLILEMLYLSSISARKKHYSQIWPQAEREYDPQKIRRFLGERLEESFPRPCRIDRTPEGAMHVSFLDRPISEAETYQFFGKCHQYLHEPNPYKKSLQVRDSECPVLLADANEKLHKLWNLLKVHYRVTQLDDGEHAGMFCLMGENEDDDVTIMTMVAE